MDDEDEEVEEGGGGMGTRMGEAEEDGAFVMHARPRPKQPFYADRACCQQFVPSCCLKKSQHGLHAE